MKREINCPKKQKNHKTDNKNSGPKRLLPRKKNCQD